MIQIPKNTEKLERFEALNKLLQLNMPDMRFGAEIGVRNGFTSEYLLKTNPNLTLYLVDPYLAYMDIHGFIDHEKQQLIKKNAALLLSQFKDRARWIIKASAEAYLEVKEALDFVFIDAVHRKESVYEDCTFWYSKIRPGGILCGHDFCHTPVAEGVALFGKKALKMVCEGDIFVIEVE